MVLHRGRGARGGVEEVAALIHPSIAGDARVVNGVTIPENFRLLHAREEQLRARAEALVEANPRLALHLLVVERAINLADMFRHVPTEDENRKVLQVLGMRVFNAFCASVKLALSGYGQASAVLLRAAVETIFLLDLFSSDSAALEHWRSAEPREQEREYSPFKVRVALDERDGCEDRRRETLYKMLSGFAVHPSMQSHLLLRPHPDGDAESGPFIEPEYLEAVLCEFARVAGEAGDVFDRFLPEVWVGALAPREDFRKVRQRWLESYLR